VNAILSLQRNVPAQQPHLTSLSKMYRNLKNSFALNNAQEEELQFQKKLKKKLKIVTQPATSRKNLDKNLKMRSRRISLRFTSR